MAAADILNPVRRWMLGPYNPPLNIEEPIPGARSEQLRSDVDLQIGAPPGRVTRLHNGRNTGYGGAESQNAFPYVDDAAHIQHLQVTKLNNPAYRQKLFSDNAYVPGIYAGNPIK